MKELKWRDVGEMVGLAAIVASLIFVGLQMKQSQEIAIAEQYQDRANAALEYMLWLADDESMQQQLLVELELIYEAGEGGEAFRSEFETFGPETLAKEFVLARTALMVFDNYYRQFQLGTMDDESWAAFRYRLKQVLSSGTGRLAFSGNPQDWRRSFQELCFELITEIENEPDPAG